jgi:hypothetical protein
VPRIGFRRTRTRWLFELRRFRSLIEAIRCNLRTGPKWITSRRGLLKLYPDRLECGNWTVVYSEIREAVLSSFRSPILRIPGYVLAVRTDKETYHFGLNGWAYWKGELPFPVTREQARIRMSAISILARVVLIGFAIYFMWNWIANR